MSNTSLKLARQKRRTRRTRYKIIRACRKQKTHRLSVHKSNMHLYVQLINDISGQTIASASTLDQDIVKTLEVANKDNRRNRLNLKSAAILGATIAQKAKKIGVETVIFDRGGSLYHGRIKALADAARESGLKF